MLTSAGRHDAPVPPYRSLGFRLPLLISVLLAAAVTVFLWAAYREVEATLLRAGGARAQSAASQVANLLADSSKSGMDMLRGAAADPRVQRFVTNPTSNNRAAARATLARLAASGVHSVDVWNAKGLRLLSIEAPPSPGATPAALPARTRPPALGFNPLKSSGTVIYTDSAAEIPGHLGSVASRATLSVNPPGILNRMVGNDAVILLGNTSGQTWTDFTHVVQPPPVPLQRNGVAEYQAPSGDRKLGAVSVVAGSPWAAWVEFPRSEIIAPAQLYLERMIALALIVVGIGALIAGLLSMRITQPLQDLVEAAGGIAGGDYSSTVKASRADEIGRLGDAFNAMVGEIQDAHRQMQARVLERSRALEALRASEEHYRTIVEVALDCIISIDAKGRVIEFNPAAERAFGYAKAEALGHELAELIVPPQSLDAHRKGVARYFATGESTLIGKRIEMTAMRKDGTLFPVELALSSVRTGGAPVVTGVARDITERKRMEEIRLQIQIVQEQNLRTVEANRLKSKFVANMSHELRTPLNAIIGFTELMHRGLVGPLSAEQREFLGDILTSSKHLLELINDVLDLAKVESGKMEFRPEPVDLASLANEVRDALRTLASSQDLRVDVEVDPAVNAAIVDRARVKQVLFNYMSNAIKFTPAGGRVRVRISRDGTDRFRIDVEDTGIGIKPSDMAKLFTEFQQLDSSAAKGHEGTGLGLALTKHIVEAQGGSVAVTSRVGQGSTFSATLPMTMSVVPDGPVSATRPASRKSPILVVDDDAATLKLADVALRESGWQTICKDNAEDALLAVQTHRPAVVVVDLLMPDVDGFDFISRLRGVPGGHDIPIVVWTIKDLDADERGLLNSSVAAVVSKRTGSSQALVDALARLLPMEPLPREGTHGS